MPRAFRTFACVATLWDLASVSHKVEISERFKSHWTDFKGQSSNLKHVEKIDDRKLNGKTLTYSNEQVDAQLHVFGLFRTFAYFNFMGQTRL